jgi:hypothetical protein
MSSTIFADDVAVENPFQAQHNATGMDGFAPAPVETDTDMVMRVRSSINRKFDFADVERNDALYAAAVGYLRDYTGNFAFLADMQQQRRKISEKQAAGVLNCMVAEYGRKQTSPERAKSDPVRYADDDDQSYEAWLDHQASSVGKGTYTVVLPMVADRVTVRLGPWRDDKRNPGKKMRWITFRQGASYTLYARQGAGQQHVILPAMRGSNGIVNSALLALFNDPNVPAEAALAYALESGRCSRCDRELTVPASLHRGMGPECVKYVQGGNESCQ